MFRMMCQVGATTEVELKEKKLRVGMFVVP
jgi:hypothetical protein